MGETARKRTRVAAPETKLVGGEGDVEAVVTGDGEVKIEEAEHPWIWGKWGKK